VAAVELPVPYVLFWVDHVCQFSIEFIYGLSASGRDTKSSQQAATASSFTPATVQHPAAESGMALNYPEDTFTENEAHFLGKAKQTSCTVSGVGSTDYTEGNCQLDRLSTKPRLT
jgi:hypothetical protein